MQRIFTQPSFLAGAPPRVPLIQVIKAVFRRFAEGFSGGRGFQTSDIHMHPSCCVATVNARRVFAGQCETAQRTVEECVESRLLLPKYTDTLEEMFAKVHVTTSKI